MILLVDKSKCWKGSTHHKTKQKTNPRENRIGVVPNVILMSDFVNGELVVSPFDKTCLRSFWYFVHLCPRKFLRASKPETYGFTKRTKNKIPSIYNHCWWHVLLFAFRSKNKIFKWCWSGFVNKNTLSNKHTRASHLLDCWRLIPKQNVHLVFCLPTRSPCFKCIPMYINMIICVNMCIKIILYTHMSVWVCQSWAQVSHWKEA